MGEWNRCIDEALSQGKITRKVADAVRESSDPLKTVNDMTALAKRQKREAAIQAVRIADAWENISAHQGSLETGLMSLMVKDVTGKAGYANVDMRASFYESRYHSIIADLLNKFHSTKFGLSQDEEGLNKLVRALYGEAIDDPEIWAIGKQYEKMLDTARNDFNRMGGDIGKHERYILPQNHDARTIRRHGKETWLSDIREWVDPEYMLDDFGNKLTPDELAKGLDYAYDTIATNGLNKAKDFTAPVGQGKKLARKHSEKRFLFFKDADSWIAYQNKYGRGDIYQTMTAHANNLANDVANMEVFGTNPRGTFDALMGQIEKTGGEMAGRKKLMLETVFKTVSGTVDHGNLTTLADFGQSIRNVITASRLGKAMLSALSDEGFSAITAGYNNLPLSSILATKVKLASNTRAAKDLHLSAVRIGLGADTWTKVANAANRYGDVYGTGRTARMAEVVMRASGLEPWTEAGRKAFTLEYSGYLAENFGKSFSDMNAKTMRAFDSYGITKADWDLFRRSDAFDHHGAKYADMTQPGGEKFHQMIMSEVDYAVPTPDARVRAMTTGASGTGTIGGQAWRSVTNLKSFPITMVTTHFYRAAYLATGGEKAAYTGMLMASTTLLGALALQAKDITSGREPREMDTKEFWGAAVAQGGGVGIFGDFFFSDVNRFGQGPVSTIFGPSGQILESTITLTLGNAQQALKGEDTNFSGEALRYIESNTPSIWQIQPVKNAMFDQLELLVDPKAQKRMSRARKRRLKDYGQGYWWGPGEVTPDIH